MISLAGTLDQRELAVRFEARDANPHEQSKRDQRIMKLAERGWTHQKIATLVGLERSVVTKVIRKFKMAA